MAIWGAILLVVAFLVLLLAVRYILADGVPCRVHVMAPLDLMTDDCKLRDSQEIGNRLRKLKSAGVDGVMVDVWWGIVEQAPKKYNWAGYRNFFTLCREIGLKIIPVMSFHKCGGNVGDNVTICLPQFAHEGEPFFVDAEGHVDDEYISPGFDSVKVGDRTPLEMYKDFMEAFVTEFGDFLNGAIELVEVGLGPCGELRYPSYQSKFWKFPGGGALQCFDEKLQERLKQEGISCSFAQIQYNSTPKTCDFWKNVNTDDTAKTFFEWYNRQLCEHAASVLKIARDIFGGLKLSGKVPGIHWWCMHPSHCAEATAGLYNFSARSSGYAEIAKTFAQYNVGMCFTCLEMVRNEAFQSDPPAIVMDILVETKKAGIPFEGENALECYDRRSFERIISWCYKGMSEFTFLRLTDSLISTKHWRTFRWFVAAMHNPKLRPFLWILSFL